MDSESICRELEQGTPLLTATQRLARAWRGRYDAWQQSRGGPAWPSADVLPWGAWVRRLSESWVDAAALGLTAAPGIAAAPAPVWLSTTQERVVWERIVAASPLGGPLLRSMALAGTAQEAHRRLAEWQLSLPAPPPDAPLEWQAFAAWEQDFTARCAKEGWMDAACQPGWLLNVLREGTLRLPPRVLLAGFDALTPQTRDLLEAVRAAGCDVRAVPPPVHRAAPVRQALPDSEAEAWCVARWARMRLEANPAAHIGIVVPDLTAQRATWERVLEDVLHPTAVLPGVGVHERAFNLSQGIPLADEPVVAAALRLLRMTPAALPLEDWSVVLRSPFIAGAEQEREARALLDVRLRRRGSAELSPAALHAGARGGREAPDGAPAPVLAEALQRWRHAWDELPSRGTPSAWAVAFAGLLAALGWPGERGSSSTEYQAVQAWHGLLEELARLELVAPTLGRGEALAALRRMALERTFQPEGSDAPVQVLGVLESGGLDFDHLWVAGLHEDAWPPPARPNALLPADLQRRHDMPRASAARELDLARAETARLAQAAPEVVFSHPERQEDRLLRPSALIAQFPARDAADDGPGLPAVPEPPLRAALGMATTLEVLTDQVAPPISAGTPVTGGTALFADQAACPFRAFAHHRLRAQAPEAPEPGLDARQRGSLVHGALDTLWDRLHDLATLQGLGEAELAQTLTESADAAVAAWAEANRTNLGARQAQVERIRLRGLLEGWLAVERERAPFQVVARESRRTLEVGGISVQGQVDRLDRLPDGRHVLIDYKTGTTRGDAWWGPRPDEPQLPLYAVTSDAPLAGVVFAQVAPARRQRPRFRGVADEPAGVPDATPPAKLKLPDDGPPPASVDALLEGWRAALEGLAQAFRSGAAQVDPKRDESCRYCELPGLCRIAEVRPRGWDEVAEGGEENGGGDRG